MAPTMSKLVGSTDILASTKRIVRYIKDSYNTKCNINQYDLPSSSFDKMMKKLRHNRNFIEMIIEVELQTKLTSSTSSKQIVNSLNRLQLLCKEIDLILWLYNYLQLGISHCISGHYGSSSSSNSSSIFNYNSCITIESFTRFVKSLYNDVTKPILVQLFKNDSSTNTNIPSSMYGLPHMIFNVLNNEATATLLQLLFPSSSSSSSSSSSICIPFQNSFQNHENRNEVRYYFIFLYVLGQMVYTQCISEIKWKKSFRNTFETTIHSLQSTFYHGYIPTIVSMVIIDNCCKNSYKPINLDDIFHDMKNIWMIVKGILKCITIPVDFDLLVFASHHSTHILKSMFLQRITQWYNVNQRLILSVLIKCCMKDNMLLYYISTDLNAVADNKASSIEGNTGLDSNSNNIYTIYNINDIYTNYRLNGASIQVNLSAMVNGNMLYIVPRRHIGIVSNALADNDNSSIEGGTDIDSNNIVIHTDDNLNGVIMLELTIDDVDENVIDRSTDNENQNIIDLTMDDDEEENENEENNENVFYPFICIHDHIGPLAHNAPEYRGSSYSLLIHWTNGEYTWEPLATFVNDSPIICAEYASENGLMNEPGWGFARYFVEE